MAELTLPRGRTAILVMDFQNDIVADVPMVRERGVLQKVKKVVARARQVGLPIIYIVVEFRPGYPEVHPRNRAARLQNSILLRDSPGAQVHPEIAPQADDLVVVKHRTGALLNTQLPTLLTANQWDTLVLMGFATSGVVLSMVRQGADLDYQLVVVEDCCADRDPETHAFLMDKILPRQATVVSSDQLLALL